MMKPKGPLDASTYTKWLRQRANIGMANNDNVQKIPQYERKSIISNAPAADLPTSGFFKQLAINLAGNLPENVTPPQLEWIINAFYTIPPNTTNIPRQIVTDSNGTVYITNILAVGTSTIEILKADQTALSYVVSTTGAAPNAGFPVSVAVYNNRLYVGGTTTIRRYDINPSGTTPSTFLTNEIIFYNVSSPTITTLTNPRAISISSTGTLYFTNNANSLYSSTQFTVTTPPANPVVSIVPFNATPHSIAGPDEIYVVNESGNDVIYVANVSTNRIIKINSAGGASSPATLVAGTGTFGSLGDGGPAIDAQINRPRGLYVDTDGTVYIGDTINGKVRKIDTSGIITTFAGNGVNGNSGDGGLATDASLSANADSRGVSGVYYSTYYNAFLIVDSGNRRVRSIKYQ